MPTTSQHVVHYAAVADSQSHIRAVFTDHARQAAAEAHPERHELAAAAEHAGTELDTAWRDLDDTHRRHDRQLGQYGSLGHNDDPDAHLARLERDVATTHDELDTVRQQIGQLSDDPAIRILPAGHLTHERDLWRAGYDTARDLKRLEAGLTAERADQARRRPLDAEFGHQRQADFGHDIARDTGPSFGR